MKYKLIIAPTPHDLEARVNKWLADQAPGVGHGFIGSPQVLGHESYAQALYYYEGIT